MTIHATIWPFKNQFVAELSDGRRIGQLGFRTMALALLHAGVRPDTLQFEWKAGQPMITPGQQVALQMEMQRLESEYLVLSRSAA